MTIGGLAGRPLTRPSAPLSPSDGERDGVRGVWSIPPFVFGNWDETCPARREKPRPHSLRTSLRPGTLHLALIGRTRATGGWLSLSSFGGEGPGRGGRGPLLHPPPPRGERHVRAS